MTFFCQSAIATPPETPGRRPDRSHVKSALKANYVSYCRNTTLHGFSYLPAGRDLCEKLFWVAIVITGLTLGGIVLNQSYT